VALSRPARQLCAWSDRLPQSRARGPDVLDPLARAVASRAPVQARAIESGEGWQSVLKRWPGRSAVELHGPGPPHCGWSSSEAGQGRKRFSSALPAEGLREPSRGAQALVAFAEAAPAFRARLAQPPLAGLLLRSPWGTYGWRGQGEAGQGNAAPARKPWKQRALEP